jgi:hypothetical protein
MSFIWDWDERRRDPTNRARTRDNAFSLLEGGVGTVMGANGVLGAIPVISEAMNAGQASYHTGSAIYDGLTGDRDGAINHGAQALYSGVGMIPGISEGMGIADLMGSAAGLNARTLASLDTENDVSQVPGGLSDVVANQSVMMTNAIFGRDDSNWFAEGDDPTGTRGGEIGSGLAMMAGGLPGMFIAHNEGLLEPMGNFAGDVFGADVDGPTSGARGPNGEANGYAQEAGDWMHDQKHSLEVGARWLGRDLGRGARGAYDVGRGLVNTGRDAVEDTVASAVPSVMNVASRGAQAARGVASAGQRAAQSVVETGQGALSVASQAGRTALAAGERTVSNVASGATRAASNVVSGARRTAGNAARGARRLAGDAWNWLTD